jgi:hypothetical protein
MIPGYLVRFSTPINKGMKVEAGHAVFLRGKNFLAIHQR